MFCILLGLLEIVSSGRVRPYGSRYITMNNVNANGWSDYNFTMTFDTLLPAAAQVWITFPTGNYPSLLGLDSSYKVYAPYPREVVSQVNDRTLQVTVGEWPSAVPLTIQVQNIKNSPKSGGTGSIAISTRLNGVLIDQNMNFAVIGLASQTNPLIRASVSIVDGYSNYAGELTNYNFSMVPSDDLPSMIDFMIIFPSIFDLSYLKPYQCYSEVLNSELFCKVHDDFKNILYMKGNNQTISKGTQIDLILVNVANPQREMQTPLFQYQIIETGTNNTLQALQASQGLQIQAGRMKLVYMSTLYSKYLPYAGYIRWFVLQFRPKNPFIAARITTDFFQIIQCSITSGLLDQSVNSDSVCTPQARLMLLTNFAAYQESIFDTKYVEVRFQARIGYQVLLTNPVQIYTYMDNNFNLLVDKDLYSSTTQVDVQSTPYHAPFAQITSSSLTVGAQITLQITFGIGMDFTFNNLILVELDTLYTGLPVCSYKAFGAVTSTIYDCTLSDGVLYFNLGTQDTIQASSCSGATCPILSVTNIFNPIYGGSYSVRTLVFGDGSQSASVEFNTTLNLAVPGFTSTKVGPVSNLFSGKTALNVNINLQDNLPAGVKNQPDPYVSYSYIEVWFQQVTAGVQLFAEDLGTGVADQSEMGCVFEKGLTPTVGSQLGCALRWGSNSPLSNDYVIVRVKNYAAVSAAAQALNVVFNIPLVYPSTTGTSPAITIRLIRYDLKVPTIIRQQTFYVVSAKNVAGSPLQASNFQGPTLDQKNIQTDTTITYYVKTVFNVPAVGTNSIYYEIPTGFTFNFTKVQVSIDNNYLSPTSIQYYPVFNIIILKLENNLPNGITHKIQFEKVDLPISLNPATIKHQIKTTQNGQFADSALFEILPLTQGSLFDVQGSIYPQDTGHLYANYSISFTTTLQSYEKASITVDFDPLYTFTGPYLPFLDNIPYCGLYNTSTTTISYAFSGSRATITNFKGLVKGQRVSLALFSITNPAAGNYQLQIAVRSADGNIVENGTFAYTINPTTFSAFTFDIDSIQSLPNNAQAQAVYFFRFKPPQLIPLGSQFQIVFPDTYTSLFSISEAAIYCGLSSDSVPGLVTQCNTDQPSQSVLITSGSHLNGVIEIQYYGLLVQNTPSTISDITIDIKYKNTLIGSTKTSPSLVILDQLPSNVNIDFTFYPRNEGEIAYYIFKLPLKNFTILSNYTIMVRFPYEYDFQVGLENLIVRSSVLSGALKYTRIPRHIFITGFYDLVSFTGSLDITVFGLINPNRLDNTATGDFGFGILKGYNLVQGSTTIPGVVPQLAPEDIQLNSITSTTQYARYTSDYQFQFSPHQAVLAQVFGGQIYVDFPNDFIIDSSPGLCEVTKSFSFFSSCVQDSFRFFLVASNSEWSANQELSLLVQQIRSPDNEGETQNFIIYNYDSDNQIVLGRTFSNLHPASLIFSYDGLQVDVNSNEAYDLEVGSYSDYLTLNITDPVQFQLTFSPNVQDSRILIDPNPVTLNIGETQVKFRLAAPRDILLTTYYITWSKTGDSIPVTYAPLRKTPINMVKGTIQRVFYIEAMDYLPVNGTSYPLYITTANPPYQEVIILMSFFKNMVLQRMLVPQATLNKLNLTSYYELYTKQGLPSFDKISEANLSTSALFVEKLMNSTNYTLNTSYSYPDSNLTINFALAGLDAPSFILNQTTSFIQIKAQEYRQPKILSYNILQITRSSIQLQVYADTKGFLYYIVADQHMPSPSFEQAQSARPDDRLLSHSNPMYGIEYIRSAGFDVNFTISDLEDNHDYELFLFIQNLNRVANPSFTRIYFKTLRSQKIALMTLKLFQSTLAPEAKMDFISRMTQMITIPKSRMIEYSTDCVEVTINTSPDPNQYYWNLLILPDPTNMNELISPLQLAQKLNARRNEIIQFMTRLDPDPFVVIQEISDDIPDFQQIPFMVDRTTSSIALLFEMTFCGTAYLVILENPTQNQPNLQNMTLQASQINEPIESAYQIKHGLSTNNLPINFTSRRITDPSQPLVFNYTNLKEKTIYDIYISLENDFQGLLFDNSSVARFSAKTLRTISKQSQYQVPLDIYSINSGILLRLAIIILLITLQI